MEIDIGQRNRNLAIWNRLHRILQCCNSFDRLLFTDGDDGAMVMAHHVIRVVLHQLPVGFGSLFKLLGRKLHSAFERKQTIARPKFFERAFDVVQRGCGLFGIAEFQDLIQVMRDVFATTKFNFFVRVARTSSSLSPIANRT